MRITIVGAVLIVATLIVAVLVIRVLIEKHKRDMEQNGANYVGLTLS